VRRVSVVGVSGSGKTTVARALAARLGVPHVELDAIYHQPGWTGLDDEEFARRVAAATAGGAWVVDGNYSRIRDIVWSRADTIVVLDLPRWRVMSQLLFRTLRRGWTGEELWAGNQEHLRNLIRRDPEQNILLWSWTNHAKNRRRYRASPADPRWAGLIFLRARSRREAQALVEAVDATRQ
jgi:adenylate kinase family enzyme